MSETLALDERRSTLTWLIAGATAGAGLIHLAVVAEHSGGDAIVPIGFVLFGVVQLALASLLTSRTASSRVVAASVAVNLAAIVAWVISRTAGLPFDPYGGVPEAVGTLDLTAALLEAGAITLAVGALVAPRRLSLPSVVAAVVAVAAIGVAAVVVATPSTPSTAAVATSGTGATAAAGAAGHGAPGHHGGGAAAIPAAGSTDEHAAEMLRIDRSRCDLGFNPQAYWDEALAMSVDTYGGGSMTMETPSVTATVATPLPLNGKSSEMLDRLISLTSISSGEGAAAALIVELGKATDEEYDAWRKWVAANPGSHSATATTTNGQPPPASMGHPGPAPWTALVDKASCDKLQAELETARATAMKYPTVADANAAGWVRVTSYVPGIAAHYMNFGLTDDKFELEKPEMLLYDGVSPDSRIVGLSYYMRIEGTATPMQGFTGDNDTYHRHLGLCIGPNGVIGDSQTTPEECADLGGRKSSGAAGWMSHAWVVPGCESPWGVFSGENPILDSDLYEASGEPGSEGCSASEARSRYDLEPGATDLAVATPVEEAVGS